MRKWKNCNKLQHRRFGPREEVEEQHVCLKHWTVRQRDQQRRALVGEKKAKLCISRLIQMWCGGFPAGLCRGQRRKKKIHTESSSIGSPRPASHTSERATTRTPWRFSSPAALAPAELSLSGPQCSGISVPSTIGVAASFLTRCRGSRIFVSVAPATLASCRGISKQNIAFQMFLQLRR